MGMRLDRITKLYGLRRTILMSGWVRRAAADQRATGGCVAALAAGGE